MHAACAAAGVTATSRLAGRLAAARAVAQAAVQPAEQLVPAAALTTGITTGATAGAATAATAVDRRRHGGGRQDLGSGGAGVGSRQPGRRYHQERNIHEESSL